MQFASGKPAYDNVTYRYIKVVCHNDC